MKNPVQLTKSIDSVKDSRTRSSARHRVFLVPLAVTLASLAFSPAARAVCDQGCELKEHLKLAQLEAAIVEHRTEFESALGRQQREFQASMAQQQEEIKALRASLKEQAVQIQKVSARQQAAQAVPEMVANGQ